jgi:hypothetical protein
MHGMFAHPMGFAGERVKRRNVTLIGREVGMLGQKRQQTPKLNAGIPAALNIFIATGGFKVVVNIKHQRAFHRRDVNQTGIRVKAHGLPIMAAKRAGQNPLRFIALGKIARVIFYRTAGFHINMRGPIHRHIRIGAQQFARLAVQHIEEAVFSALA